MSIYSSLVRPLLFRLPAETAHQWTVEACRVAGRVAPLRNLVRHRLEVAAPELRLDLLGLSFQNPVGLAAGWDKNGRAVSMLGHLGFGHVEIGSISASPSEGNPKPRLFRLPEDRAILVNYGLPNIGARQVSERLAKEAAGSPAGRVPLGINMVATNHGTATRRDDDEILRDYVRSSQWLSKHADYLTLNLSCPNAEGGKDLFAEPGQIAELLSQLKESGLDRPVVLKLPPIWDPSVHDRWLLEVDPFDFVRGFMFNLPTTRPAAGSLRTPPDLWESLPGAVAGPPVERQINRCIAALFTRIDPRRHVIIGGGGISTADDAWRKITLGASLVQIYTAMVYQGPGIVRRINLGLLQRVRQHGFGSLREAIGTAGPGDADEFS